MHMNTCEYPSMDTALTVFISLMVEENLIRSISLSGHLKEQISNNNHCQDSYSGTGYEDLVIFKFLISCLMTLHI